jgi:general secretion pathway protein D
MEKILSKLVSQMNGMSSKSAKKGVKVKKAMVVGDAERNALIVLATGEQIKNIRKVIRSIDVEKPQVYIVAKIVEIKTGLASRIGIKYGFEGGKITSRGLFSLAGSTGASSLTLGSKLLGFLQTETTTGDSTTTNNKFSFDSNIKELFALGATVDLLKSNGAANIMSEPSVLCTNNQESEIYVGETRSILTSSTAGDNKNDVVRNNYSREDIGITLKVKPRLSSRNKVTLTVNAIIEDVDLGSSTSTDRPTTTKRKVSTNAIVSNGQTIILGGLIKNSSGKSVSKVPILGDIPLLGELFKSTAKDESGVNVVIYITPYIVRRSSDLVKLKKALGELSAIQSKYNRLIREKLEGRSAGHSTAQSTRSNEGEQDAMRMLGFKRRHRNTTVPVVTPVKESHQEKAAVVPVKKAKKPVKKTKKTQKTVASPVPKIEPEPTKQIQKKQQVAPKPKKVSRPKESRVQKRARLKREAFERRKLERKRKWELKRLKKERSLRRSKRHVFRRAKSGLSRED